MLTLCTVHRLLVMESLILSFGEFGMPLRQLLDLRLTENNLWCAVHYYVHYFARSCGLLCTIVCTIMQRALRNARFIILQCFTVLQAFGEYFVRVILNIDSCIIHNKHLLVLYYYICICTIIFVLVLLYLNLYYIYICTITFVFALYICIIHCILYRSSRSELLVADLNRIICVLCKSA